MRRCPVCGKELTEHQSCSWECTIAEAKAEGYTVHTPNNFPIRCIAHRSKLLTECEHGDHRDYKFPVTVERGAPEPDAEYVEYPETHALIYTDGTIALTLYECEYFMWLLWDGGRVLNPKPHAVQTSRLSAESLAKILSPIAMCKCGHPIDQHFTNSGTGAVHCSIWDGKMCPCTHVSP